MPDWIRLKRGLQCVHSLDSNLGYFDEVKIREVQLLERKLPPHKEGEVLARLAEPQDRCDLEGVRVVENFGLRRGGGDLVRLQLPSGMSTAEGIAWLEKNPRFEYVTSNDLRKTSSCSDDYDPIALWGLQRIQAPAAWHQTTGSHQGPINAVLDTGVDVDHPDLKANVWTNPGEIPDNGIDDDGNGVVDDVHGYDAVHQHGNPRDDYGHGTHCAGTIGAVGDNDQGVVGVNWQAQLMPVKMMQDGEGSVADTVRAISYATRMGARITSNSYGGGYNEAERDAFENSPLLHICAAGNESNDNDVSPYYPQDRPVGYPASYPFENIISVGASDRRDRLARFSNYGERNVDLAAPGTGTLSTVPGGGYETKSGTSMATPHVAGVAGLIATLYPQASNEEIRTRLLANVDPLPAMRGKVASGGRLNAQQALEVDTIPPDAPSQVEAKSDGAWLDVSWVNSGDDGLEGDAYRYHVSSGNYQLSGPALASGEAQQVRIPAGTGSVSVRLEDNVGNLSKAGQVDGNSVLQTVSPNWNSDGNWGQVDKPGRSGIWTDSPSGPYANGANSALTSDWVDLSQLEKPLLRFEARHRLEPSSDFVYLEAQKQGSEDWQRLDDFTSYHEWQDHHIDLSQLTGTVRFRFRLQSDNSKVEDGFWMYRPEIVGGASGTGQQTQAPIANLQ